MPLLGRFTEGRIGVIGFSVSTAIGEAANIYLRYEGNIPGQDSRTGSR